MHKILLRGSNSYYWNSLAKFILIPLTDDFSVEQFGKILNYFFNRRIINVIVIHGTEDNGTMVAGQLKDPLNGLQQATQMVKANEIQDLKVAFPDHFKNLSNYSLQLMLAFQPPRLWYKKEKFCGFDAFFLRLIGSQLNCKYHAKIYVDGLSGQQTNQSIHAVDFSLITGVPITFGGLTMNIPTFGYDGYCAMVPIYHQKSFFYNLLKPFDAPTWILMFIAIFLGSILWNFIYKKKLSRSPNSTWYFFFSVYASFLGKSVPMISLCLLQTCVLQIFVFMSFFCGNIYQSEIISFLIQTSNGTYIKSIEELKNSDITLIVDHIFFDMAIQSNYDDKFLSRMIQLDPFTPLKNFQERYTRNEGLIIRCDIATLLTDSVEKGSLVKQLYHIIPEKLYVSTEYYSISKFSPFYDKLTFFTSAVFESGLRDYWKFLVTMFKWKDEELKVQRGCVTTEEYTLKMSEFKYIFMVLVVGWGMGLIAFLAEHLYNFYARWKNSRR